MAMERRRLRSSAQSGLKSGPKLHEETTPDSLKKRGLPRGWIDSRWRRRRPASHRRTSAFADARCAVGASHGAYTQRATACPNTFFACQLTLSVCLFCRLGRFRRRTCQRWDDGSFATCQVFTYTILFNTPGAREWGGSPLATSRVQIKELRLQLTLRGLGPRPSTLSGWPMRWPKPPR